MVYSLLNSQCPQSPFADFVTSVHFVTSAHSHPAEYYAYRLVTSPFFKVKVSVNFFREINVIYSVEALSVMCHNRLFYQSLFYSFVIKAAMTHNLLNFFQHSLLSDDLEALVYIEQNAL